MISTVAPIGRARKNTTYRWVRQIHLWVGAWGALAAIIYGFTGLVMNHRFGDSAWYQGDSSDAGRTELSIPADARGSAEALSTWLRQAQSLDATLIRKGGGRGRPGATDEPPKWNLSGGDATGSWSIEYAPGTASAELKRSAHSPLAAFNRLHKGVGGGWTWILLADSFAIGMLLLGISGIWMWVRGRSATEMTVSVFALSTVILIAVLGPALL